MKPKQESQRCKKTKKRLLNKQVFGFARKKKYSKINQNLTSHHLLVSIYIKN